MLFNLDGQWAVAPGGELGVEGRNQGVPSDAHGGRRGVEQSVIARMRGVGLKLPQTLDKKIQGLESIHRRGEIEAREQGAELHGIERRGDRRSPAQWRRFQ